MKRTLLPVLLLAVPLLLAGCGNKDEEATPTGTDTVTTPVEMEAVSAYFIRDGKIWPVAREVPKSTFPTRVVPPLLYGPTAQEKSDLALSSAVGKELRSVVMKDGVAVVDVSKALSRPALAQFVFTLTQSPAVESVEVDGKKYTRKDFEDLTPAILVESPLAFQDVPNPLRATGSANTFEATFQYELTDTDGKIVDTGFATATSGTGERGTFDFTTKPYAVPFDGTGSLVVYELSAEDGTTRLHLVEIPVQMAK